MLRKNRLLNLNPSDTGFLLDSTPDKFAKTSAAGFGAVVDNTKQGTLSYWHGEKETVCWDSMYVGIKGKRYKIISDAETAYSSVMYAFIKNGYLIVICDTYSVDYTNYAIGVRVYEKNALNKEGLVCTPVFTNHDAFNGLYQFYSLMVNRAATKIIMIGKDADTPTSGLPDGIPAGAGSGTNNWRSVLRHNFSEITPASLESGGWLTTGIREDFYNSHVYELEKTIVTIPTDGTVYYETIGDVVNSTQNATADTTESHILTPVHVEPIKIYACFNGNDVEHFAVFTSLREQTYSYHSHYVATYTGQQTSDEYGIATVTSQANLDSFLTISSHFLSTDTITFRGISFDDSAGYDTTHPSDVSSFATTVNCTRLVIEPRNYGTYERVQVSQDMPSGSVDVNDYVVTSKATQNIIGVSQYVDDCTFVFKTQSETLTHGVYTRDDSYSIESKRTVFDFDLPAPTHSEHDYGFPAPVSIDNVANYESYEPQGAVAFKQDVIAGFTDVSFEYQTITPPSFHDDFYRIKAVADRHGNMIYAVKNPLPGIDYAGCKIYKANFGAETAGKQAEISEIVTEPNKILGVI